ncbi:MAG: hypothetical protein Q7T16_05865 [Candidatus Burarchaeum sp.]|nr:hypothetical protein [Candidatus Burarchaeum sp.]MDO8340153.1 hypothetical protein [Candidatus Burarchaeum sp.]
MLFVKGEMQVNVPLQRLVKEDVQVAKDRAISNFRHPLVGELARLASPRVRESEKKHVIGVRLWQAYLDLVKMGRKSDEYRELLGEMVSYKSGCTDLIRALVFEFEAEREFAKGESVKEATGNFMLAYLKTHMSSESTKKEICVMLDILEQLPGSKALKLTKRLADLLRQPAEVCNDVEVSALYKRADFLAKNKYSLGERIAAAAKTDPDLLEWPYKNPITDFFSFNEKHRLAVIEIRAVLSETLPRLTRGGNLYNSLVKELAGRPAASLEAIKLALLMETYAAKKAAIILDVLERIDGGNAVDLLELIIYTWPEELKSRAQSMLQIKKQFQLDWAQSMTKEPPML